MSSLLTTGLPPAALQPFLRQLKDHSVSAAFVDSWSGSGGREGWSRTFFRILRVRADDEGV